MAALSRILLKNSDGDQAAPKIWNTHLLKVAKPQIFGDPARQTGTVSPFLPWLEGPAEFFDRISRKAVASSWLIIAQRTSVLGGQVEPLSRNDPSRGICGAGRTGWCRRPCPIDRRASYSMRRPPPPSGNSNGLTGALGSVPLGEGTGTPTKQVLPPRPSGCRVRAAILAVLPFPIVQSGPGRPADRPAKRAFND